MLFCCVRTLKQRHIILTEHVEIPATLSGRGSEFSSNMVDLLLDLVPGHLSIGQNDWKFLVGKSFQSKSGCRTKERHEY